MPDWANVRKRYPALKEYIYCDNAAVGVVSAVTARAAQRYYKEVSEGGNCVLPEWQERQEDARQAIATLIGARPSEIAFVTNTSTGMNIAALMLKGAGDVITNSTEFPASTLPWVHMGYKVKFIRVRKNVVLIEEVKDAIGRKRRGIIVHSYVQYATGFKQDMAGLGRLARKRGHYFVANIVQGAGALPVDVKEWGVDIACGTGLKWLCAGYGTGFIYVREELLRKLPAPLAGWFSVKDPMNFENRTIKFKDGAARLELGGPAFACIFALGNATREILKLGVNEISQRIYELTDYLLEKLREVGIGVTSDTDSACRSGIMLVKAFNPAMLVEVLKARGIRVSERSGGVRISPHFYNNHDDVDRLVYHLAKFV